jgi:sirohydrochlorin cobaltochelatase
MLQVIPSSRKPQDAVVLMGHGSVKHPADAIYAAMNQVFMDMDPNVHVGTAEYPAMVDI